MATCKGMQQSSFAAQYHQRRQPAGIQTCLLLGNKRQRPFQPAQCIPKDPNPRPGRSSCCSRLRVVAKAQQSTDAVAQPAIIEVTLPTEEAQQTIKFALTKMGRGRAVLINRLVGGSAASEAGVRPGQRLMQISDPIRANEMWTLNDRPSIGFVRDALAMRRSETITLVVTRDSVFQPGASMQSLASIDIETDAAEMSSEATSAAEESEQTIADRLAQEWQRDQQVGSQQQSDFERRQRRRKEYFERESARDDGKFVLAAAAVVVLPALAILAAAFFSGYLDRLSDSYMTTR